MKKIEKVLNKERKLIGNLVFKSVELTEEYKKEWNINPSLNDFGMLYKNGQLVNDSLFRVGGMFSSKIDESYTILLEQTESFYSDEIMKMSKNHIKPETTNKHLDNVTVIVDKNGIVKESFDSLSYPSLIGGLIYLFNNKCYNIETKEVICDIYSSVVSKDYIFIENQNSVYQIILKTGEYIIHSK